MKIIDKYSKLQLITIVSNVFFPLTFFLVLLINNPVVELELIVDRFGRGMFIMVIILSFLNLIILLAIFGLINEIFNRNPHWERTTTSSSIVVGVCSFIIITLPSMAVMLFIPGLIVLVRNPP